MNSKAKKIFLLIGDFLVLYFALYITLWIRYHQIPDSSTWQNHLWPFSITFIFWVIIFYISNLYNLHIAVNNAKFINRTIRSVGIAGLLSVAFFYLNPNINIAPKTNMIIFVFVFILFFTVWRRLFNALLYGYLPKDNVAIIGLNPQTQEIIKTLREKPHLGFNISLIVSNHTTNKMHGVDITNNLHELKTILERKKISTVVISPNPHQESQLRSALFECLPLGIKIFNLPDFYEMITGKIPLEAINKMWFLENLSKGQRSLFDFLKRIYDIILALLLLFATILFWPIIGLLLKIENKEAIFFIQKRAGKNQAFNLIKFRTQKTISSNPAPSVKNDSRTTKIGSILRKTRIDELPQIINILKGDMSFVGPRPERPEIIEKLKNKIPFYQERMLVKPGLTGWDQISGEYHSSSLEDTIKKLQYDLFYIKNRSIYLDLSIILKTIATVLSKAGV